ncbi:DUF6876 family protein [Aetokthonos hydrillicola]|nr:DUF6876 family protein [Aetokthonos hydrillicola]MBO3462853.1 hypothetical protein [Aetokthonos hydrillicola CCALA 1050]MBW4590980.1 hypothetical protein [Aetokthonos hydrillicola CCALA 1050]
MKLSDKASNLLLELRNFTGSETLFYIPPFKTFNYTEGVRYLAQEAGAYWLIQLIAGFQKDKRLKAKWEILLDFQLWKLTVNEDKTAVLCCEDGNYNVILSHKIEYTNFPLSEIELFCENQVLLLPTEH